MKTLLTLAGFLIISLGTNAQNALIQLSGKLVDKQSGEPLVGAAISVKGTQTGTHTDPDGKFVLKTTNSFPFTLQITYNG